MDKLKQIELDRDKIADKIAATYSQPIQQSLIKYGVREAIKLIVKELSNETKVENK
jgi:hypothetical protein